MKITTKQLALERILNNRLKMIGYILLLSAALACAWDFLPSTESEFDELLLEIEETPPPLNPYLVSSVFAAVGTTCLIIHWKKKSL